MGDFAAGRLRIGRQEYEFECSASDGAFCWRVERVGGGFGWSVPKVGGDQTTGRAPDFVEACQDMVAELTRIVKEAANGN